jgi:hypothetical protein
MSRIQVLRIQYVHEAASATNLAFSLVAFLFLFDFRPATSALFRMNVAIYRRLHLLPDLKVPKDSYTGEYFAFFVPALVLAFCLWLLLRLCCRVEFIREFLRSVAGIAALVAPPVWWLCFTYGANRRYGWTPFAATQFHEVVLVLALAMLYLYRNWPSSEWAAIAVLVLHYGFWFWQFGPHFFFMGYGGPIAPAAGLCAGLAWLLYLGQLRRLQSVACG